VAVSVEGDDFARVAQRLLDLLRVLTRHEDIVAHAYRGS
jgi:hypothetical protein